MLSYRKMHKDEIEVTTETITLLLKEQFPSYAALPLQRVNSMGTVNAIYRIGQELCVRLPLLNDASLRREWDILPVIAPKVSITVPEIVEKGKPTELYPLHWAIYRWLPGHIYDGSLTSETATAKILAQFIRELHSIPLPCGAPQAGRKPLAELNEVTVAALKECGKDIDVERALKLWRELRDTEPWNNVPVWIHADLLKPNLIVSDGKLAAVIDFGSAGIGDPAFDIIPAWTVLTSATRELFRSLLDIDDSTWCRARAYALHQAALIIPYYRESNPAFAKQARDTVHNIL